MKQPVIFLIICTVFSPLFTATVSSHRDPSRKSSEPYISGDSFRSLADYIFDETTDSFAPEQVKNGDIIFVKTDYMARFFTEKHPAIKKQYILITHNSDEGAPGDYAYILDDEKILVWFGQNATITNHPKFIPIPIGLANQRWAYGRIETFNKVIEELKQYAPIQEHLLGINFRPDTNRRIRKPIYDYFSTKEFCVNIETSNHEQYLKNMSRTKFIISPPGNGLDCHRTWESLLVGAIPIVETSTLDDLFSDLPVLIITHWHEVTEQYLHLKYQELCHKQYDHKKIYFSYWKELINSYKKH